MVRGLVPNAPWQLLLLCPTLCVLLAQGPDLWEGRGGFACPAKYTWAGPRAAAKMLGSLGGHFAFTVWDSVNRRLVAARDHQAKEAMFWGAPTFGEGLLFSTER